MTDTPKNPGDAFETMPSVDAQPEYWAQWGKHFHAEIKAALTPAPIDVASLYLGAANEDEAMCQVTSIYNDGWNACIDQLYAKGMLRATGHLQTPVPDDKETLAKWMIVHGFTTGHGDTIEALLDQLSWQVIQLRDGQE